MTEAQLLSRFEVSRAPIRQALQELTSEGYVYRKQGKGTFPVTGTRVQRPADVRSGALYQYLSDSGLHPTGQVSGVERVEPPARIRDILGLEAQERLLHFTRLITVEDEPLVEADVYIRAPDEFSPTAAELEDQGSAFELLEKKFGITPVRAEHEAWATAATAATSSNFRRERGQPLARHRDALLHDRRPARRVAFGSAPGRKLQIPIHHEPLAGGFPWRIRTPGPRAPRGSEPFRIGLTVPEQRSSELTLLALAPEWDRENPPCHTRSRHDPPNSAPVPSNRSGTRARSISGGRFPSRVIGRRRFPAPPEHCPRLP